MSFKRVFSPGAFLGEWQYTNRTRAHIADIVQTVTTHIPELGDTRLYEFDFRSKKRLVIMTEHKVA